MDLKLNLAKPVKKESIKIEPVKIEPVKVDRVKVEPVKIESSEIKVNISKDSQEQSALEIIEK
jgi:hypothetical protein